MIYKSQIFYDVPITGPKTKLKIPTIVNSNPKAPVKRSGFTASAMTNGINTNIKHRDTPIIVKKINIEVVFSDQSMPENNLMILVKKVSIKINLHFK